MKLPRVFLSRTWSTIALWAFMSSNAVAQLPRYTDETLAQLPADTQSLRLRGATGYGTDVITDNGIEKLKRYAKLRFLHAGELGLTDRCLEAIGELSELEELSLDGNKLTGAGLEHLVKLKKLKRLNLNFNPLGQNWPELVSKLQTLEELQAVCYERATDDALCVSLSGMENLTRLDLNDEAKDVTDIGIAALCKLRNLSSIRLKNSQVSGNGLALLAMLKKMTVLHLSYLPSVEPGSLHWLPLLTQLRELNLNAIALNHSDLDAINQLPSLDSLLIWSIRWPSKEPALIESLSGLKSLRAIRTNEKLSATALWDLSHIRTVEFIGDELTEITDEQLVQLAKLPKLGSLMLDSPHITSRSLEALSSMKSLRFLNVSDKVEITPEQLTLLGKDSLPQCKIVDRLGKTVYHDPLTIK